jgi:hypothetical protein
MAPESADGLADPTRPTIPPALCRHDSPLAPSAGFKASGNPRDQLPPAIPLPCGIAVQTRRIRIQRVVVRRDGMSGIQFVFQWSQMQRCTDFTPSVEQVCDNALFEERFLLVSR